MTYDPRFNRADLATVELEARRMRAEAFASGLRRLTGSVGSAVSSAFHRVPRNRAI